MAYNNNDPFADLPNAGSDPFSDLPDAPKGGLSAAIGFGVDKVQETGYRAIKGFTDVGENPNDSKAGTAGRWMAESVGQGGSLSKFADKGIARNLQEQQAYKQTIPSYKDVNSIGDAASYVGELTASSLPYMAAALYPPTLFAMGGGLSNEAYEAQDVKSPARAVASGYGQIALERFGALGSIGKIGNATKQVASGKVKGVVKSALGEGVTEAGQDALAQWGTGKGLDQIDTDSMTESFVGGAAVGGTIRTGTETFNAAKNKIKPPLSTVEETDLLDRGDGDTEAPVEQTVGDETTAYDPNIAQSGIAPIEGEAAADWQPNWTSGRDQRRDPNGMQPYIYEGEFDPFQDIPNSVPVGQVLESPIIEGEFEQQRQLPDRSQTIVAADGRSAQAAQEFASQAQDNYQPRLPQKDIIFAQDGRDIKFQENGNPFGGKRSVAISKGFKAARANGLEPEVIKVNGGYGWIGNDNAQVDAPATNEQSAQALVNPTNKPANDLAGNKIDKQWTAFADDSGTKKIARADMPQIKSEYRGAMVNFMNAKGVDHVKDEVPAGSLKPTQAEFSPDKVKKALGFEGTDRSILVSSDNHVLDGHHQWLAKREKGENVKVIRLDAPIEDLVGLANEFPSSDQASNTGKIKKAEPVIAPLPASKPQATKKVYTPGGRELDVEYTVVEADDLVASNDDAGNVNPDYPQILQPRDRSRASSQLQINSITNNINPALLGDSATTSDGAPIISDEGVVESGNGRSIALKRAYAQGKAGKYKASLSEQGYNVDGMSKPVLVRVRRTQLSDQELQDYTKESNERSTLSMSVSETAKSDASKVLSVIDDYAGGDLSAAANRSFVTKFMQGAVSKTEQASMIDKSGQLSQDGRRRVEGALISAAYNDDALVNDIFESSDSDIRAIGGALLDSAGSWAKMRSAANQGAIDADADITTNVVEAVNLIKRARSEGKKLSELANQSDIFSGDVDPLTKAVLDVFYSGANYSKARSRKAVNAALDNYARLSESTKSGGLFDDAALEPVNATQLLEKANEQNTQQETSQESLFTDSIKSTGTGDARPSQGGKGSSVNAQSQADPKPQEVSKADDGGVKIKHTPERDTKAFVKRSDWNNFPDVFIHNKLGSATTHPEYDAAKGGDEEAAIKLVADLIDTNKLKEIKRLVGDADAITLAVHAEETISRNKIPQAMADYIGQALGLEIDINVVQSSFAGRTGKDGFGRLAAQPAFDGEIKKGETYIIMDDTVTQGGTLANLRGYVESKGGDVAAATALTGKQYSAKLALSDETLSNIREQYSESGLEKWWGEQFGYGFEKLTESEARYLLRAKDADKIRARITSERQAPSSRENESDSRKDENPQNIKPALPTDNLSFNRSKIDKPAKGVTLTEAELATKGFLDHYKGLEDKGFKQYVTDKKPSDLWGPSIAADDNFIKGAFDKDSNALYIFSKNHESIEDVRATLREELLTHKGLGVFNEAQIDELINAINETRNSTNKQIQKIWTGVNKNYADKPLLVQAEEFLGKVAQQKPNLIGKYWNKIVAALTKMFRKAGLVQSSITMSEMRAKVYEIGAKLQAGKQSGNYGYSAQTTSDGGINFNQKKPIPDTIEVNGKSRDTKDSEGHLIHNTPEGIKNFWTWRDGKNELRILDGKGQDGNAARRSGSDVSDSGLYFGRKWETPENRPAILRLRDSAINGGATRFYHGTKQDIAEFDINSKNKKDHGWLGRGIYISPFPSIAQNYANIKKGGTNPNVIPLYAKINNPIMVDETLKYNLMDKSQADIAKWTDEQIEKGFDSVVMTTNGKEIIEVVVFNPNQLKSTVGNNGGYSPLNNDIRFNRTATMDADTDSNFNLPEETKPERAIRFVQDKLNRVKKVQKVIFDAGIKTSDSADVYGKESLYYGKVEEGFRQLSEEYIKPIADKLASAGIPQPEFDLYLYALHAKERNAYINTIDESMESGSGMTDQEADAVIASVNSDPRSRVFKELNTMVRTMIDERVESMRDAGLIDEETFASLQDSYQNYVPLKGQAKDEGGKPKGTGMGFNIKGRETIAALGRKSKAESPLLHSFIDTQKAIVRGHRREVGGAMLNLVEQAPNPDVWNSYTTEGPLEREKDSSGKVVNKAMPASTMSALASSPMSEWFATKRDGVAHYIKFEDPLIAQQMKSFGVDNGNLITRTLGYVNRYLSMMSTSANPEFLLTNALRDIQTALFNVASETEIADGRIKGLNANKFAKKVMADLPRSFKGIRDALRNEDVSSEWGKHFDKFRKDGAKTGYFDMKDLEGQERDLQKLMKMQGKGDLSRIKDGALKFIEDYNSSVENAIRLSVYKNAIDSGVGEHKAAVLAKNLTVNFNRKGEAGTWLNSLFLFANAGIQGTANFARAIGTFKVVDGQNKLNLAQKAGIAMAGIAFSMSVLNRMISDDDDDGESYWDKIPEYVKERNFVLMHPNGQDYFTLPMPYGYNIFANFGTAAESLMSGGKVSDNAAFLTKAVMGSFLPLGLSEGEDGLETAIKTVTPQIGKPFIDISTNSNFFGGQIYNDAGRVYGDKRSDSALGRTTTNEVFKSTAKGLNSATGGTEYQSGFIDMHPETLRYIIEYLGGGFGATALRTSESVARGTKGEFEPAKTPFTRRLYGEVTQYSDQSDFYDRAEEVGKFKAEFKSLKGKAKLDFRKENADLIRLDPMAAQIKKSLKLLRNRKKIIDGREGMEDKVKLIDEKMETLIDRFNKEYNEVMGKR